MNFKSKNLDITDSPNQGENHLTFKFKGQFTEDASIIGTKAWGEEFELKPQESFTFIWDCSNMQGFEPAARKEWYKSMQLYKDRISEVIVISNNIIIRGAARVMLSYFNIKGQFLKSTTEL